MVVYHCQKQLHRLFKKEEAADYIHRFYIEHDEGTTSSIDIPDQQLTPDNSLIRSQRIQILRSIVEQLQPNYRQLVKLRYFKEYSYEEISEELSIPLGTVKAQLHRSREKLFKILSGKKDMM